jgi:hypothetical protein
MMADQTVPHGTYDSVEEKWIASYTNLTNWGTEKPEGEEG